MADSSSRPLVNRRRFLGAACSTALSLTCAARAETASAFDLRYILASAMYGTMPLSEIISEVKKTGADAIDIWPRVHGNQREQIDEMGRSTFAAMLANAGVRLGGIACYKPGPFHLESEIQLVRDLGQKNVVLVTGAGGGKGLRGKEREAAVRRFIEKMKPHVEAAQEAGCVVAIENHANDLLETPEAIRLFGEFVNSDSLGLALAPHHLPQDAELIAGIVRDLGKTVKFVYAQQHGHGSSVKLPKEEEMLQMPGRGPLDFKPIVKALAEINYRGYTEIFMHPVPRGVPILETAEAITDEINQSRLYLEQCVQSVNAG